MSSTLPPVPAPLVLSALADYYAAESQRIQQSFEKTAEGLSVLRERSLLVDALVQAEASFLDLASRERRSLRASAVATAQFRDITSVTNAVVGVVVNPHDAMGPSSRKTLIVFSEIMYKPAARSDGKNLEFLELYNSNPWFQDISGYQITCADMNYTFPPNTKIPGGGYLVIAAAPADNARLLYEAHPEPEHERDTPDEKRRRN